MNSAAEILAALDWTPAYPCDAEGCEQNASLVIRFACNCPAVVCCEECRDLDMAEIHLMEARGTLNGFTGMTWNCPECVTEHTMPYPNLYDQVVVSTVPL